MKSIILGCGSSVGSPVIGCSCEVCLSGYKKNRRTRSSIYVEYKNTSLIVDTSPDLRWQALNAGIRKVDGVFYTHSHADHINGIDDMKSFNFLMQKPIPAFGDQFTMDYLEKAFPFVFWDNVEGKGWYKPWLKRNVIEFGNELHFGDINVKTFEMKHGTMSVMGYRFNDIAYTTDTNFIDEYGFEILKGTKLWIIDCLRFEHSDTHATFDMAMKWINKVQPDKAVLTHMAHDMDYRKLVKMLPSNIVPAYDGMVLEI